MEFCFRVILIALALMLMSNHSLLSQNGRLHVERLTSGPSVNFNDFPAFSAIRIKLDVPGLRINSEVSLVSRIVISETETLLIVTPTNQRLVFEVSGYAKEALEITAIRPLQVLWVRVRIVTIDEEAEIYLVVEEDPELIVGLEGLQRGLLYPEIARKKGIEGRVFVQFVVDEKGNVIDPIVTRGIGGGCDEAALEAVRKAKFNPGKQRGRPVKVQYSIPVTFRLQN
jgi:TonB family protein